MWCKQYVHMMEYYLVTKRHEIVTDTGTATTLHCLKAEWEQDNKNRTKKKKERRKYKFSVHLFGSHQNKAIIFKIQREVDSSWWFLSSFLSFLLPTATHDLRHQQPPATRSWGVASYPCLNTHMKPQTHLRICWLSTGSEPPRELQKRNFEDNLPVCFKRPRLPSFFRPAYIWPQWAVYLHSLPPISCTWKRPLNTELTLKMASFLMRRPG